MLEGAALWRVPGGVRGIWRGTVYEREWPGLHPCRATACDVANLLPAPSFGIEALHLEMPVDIAGLYEDALVDDTSLHRTIGS